MWENRLYKGELVARRPARSTWTASRCRCCMRSPSTTTSCPTRRPSRWWRMVGSRRQGRARAQGRPRQPRGRGQRGQAAVAQARRLAGEALDMTTTAHEPQPTRARLAYAGGDIVLRLMTPADGEAVLAFAQRAGPARPAVPAPRHQPAEGRSRPGWRRRAPAPSSRCWRCAACACSAARPSSATRCRGRAMWASCASSSMPPAARQGPGPEADPGVLCASRSSWASRS